MVNNNKSGIYHQTLKYWLIIFICGVSLTTSLRSYGQQVKWNIYKINPSFFDSTNTVGDTIMLSENNQGSIYNPLNLLIIQNSEWILNDNEKSKLVSEAAINKIFTRNSQDQNQTETGAYLKVSTSIVFCNETLLCYKVISETYGSRDLGSPYIEYLNIDLLTNKLLKTYDVFDINKQRVLNDFLYAYANNHKQEIVKHYRQMLSAREGDQLNPYPWIFRPNHHIEKVHINTAFSPEVEQLQKNGMMFNVEMIDSNAKKNENDHNFTSALFVPYEILKPYFKHNSDVYKALLKLSSK